MAVPPVEISGVLSHVRFFGEQGHRRVLGGLAQRRGIPGDVPEWSDSPKDTAPTVKVALVIGGQVEHRLRFEQQIFALP
ncbi:MAG: hypothetical protein M0Z36_02590 [Thermaerobacter sp.]|nr:hypothetical protein [Thermaerobacter sp.]